MLRNSIRDILNRRGFLTDIVFIFALTLFISIGFRSIIFYQSELPVFLFTKTYFKQFIFYSGGISEYVAAFIRQFYFIFEMGILITVLIISFVLLLSNQIVKKLNIHPGFRFFRFVPAIFLFYIHCNYNHNLAFTVGFLISLISFYVFILIEDKKSTVFRLLLFLILLLFVYYTSGGLFIHFSLLCILYELTFNPSNKRFYSAVAFFAFCVVLPYFSAKYIFHSTLDNSYFYLIPEKTVFTSRVGEFLILLFFPALLFILLISKKIGRPITGKKNHGYFVNKISSDSLKSIVEIIIVVASITITFFFSRDKLTDIRLKVQYYAKAKQWEDVLETADKYPIIDKIISFQTNRALFHTNQLGEKMFNYPQHYGVDGLFVDRYDDSRMLELSSDLCFDLGYINESRHWAIEAFVFYGNRPEILKRLALVYIINNNYEAAGKFLNLLSKTLFYRNWAKEYKRKCLDTKLLDNDDLVQGKRLLQPQFDFFADRNNPDIIMKFLLKQNSKNKMAFEYLMAYYMLSNKFLSFNENLIRLNDFNYDKIPKNFQEAISVVIDIVGENRVELGRYKFDREVMLDFQTYISLMKHYKGNFTNANRPLQTKFGNTYWYFLDYISPSTREIRTRNKNN